MQDLRSLMAAVEKRLPREFVRITKEVDPKYEITAIVKKADQEPYDGFRECEGISRARCL